MSWFPKKMAKLLNKRLLAVYALVVVSIIGLTVFVQNYPVSNFDLNITQEIQEQRPWILLA